MIFDSYRAVVAALFSRPWRSAGDRTAVSPRTIIHLIHVPQSPAQSHYRMLMIDASCNPSWVSAESDRGKPASHECQNEMVLVHSDRYASSISVIALLKACARNHDLCEGTKIHAEILKTGLLEMNPYIGSSLVSMYAKLGAQAKSQDVFDELPVRNLVCWNALVAGYVQHGRSKEAMNCIEQMQKEGFSPDSVTYVCILKACSDISALDNGKQIHDKIAKDGMLGRSITLDTALVTMYAKCGDLEMSQEVFDGIPVRNVVAWNALITGYVEQGRIREALTCFGKMQREGFCPDAITYVCILKACASMHDYDMGKQIHSAIVGSQWFAEKETILSTALLDMYAKCGALDKAEQVFHEIPIREVACWNALIAGYIKQAKPKKALDLFEKMMREDFSPNVVTYVCILKACADMGDLEKGKLFHDQIIENKLIEKHAALGNALIDMYAKCGVLEKSQELINELPVCNMVRWNALISRYAQQGQNEAALNCFYKMQKDGFSPDSVTFSSILKVCASTGAISMGKQIHKEIIKDRSLEKDVVLGTALVDMYGKCGAVGIAEEVFNILPVRDVACWTALIAGYAHHGLGEKALGSFAQMQEAGFPPDLPSFLCVLNACSHSGLIGKGETYFMDMTAKYGLTPALQHLNCMVHLFGSTGHLDKALTLVPSGDNLSIWRGLLDACRKWGNIEIGKLAFEQVVRHNASVPCVIMNKIQA